MIASRDRARCSLGRWRGKTHHAMHRRWLALALAPRRLTHTGSTHVAKAEGTQRGIGGRRGGSGLLRADGPLIW